MYKSFGYMECLGVKLDCRERGGSLSCDALTETKLEGKGKVSWCGVNGIIVGIQEIERAREGVAILMNDEWHSNAVDF